MNRQPPKNVEFAHWSLSRKDPRGGSASPLFDSLLHPSSAGTSAASFLNVADSSASPSRDAPLALWALDKIYSCLFPLKHTKHMSYSFTISDSLQRPGILGIPVQSELLSSQPKL